jgi:hypothetical protein
MKEHTFEIVVYINLFKYQTNIDFVGLHFQINWRTFL